MRGTDMKKTIVLLIAMLSVSALFASGVTDEGAYKGVTDYAMTPYTVEPEDGVDYSLYGNAASLATARADSLKIQFPYFESGSYNVATALRDKGFAEAMSKLTKFQWGRNNWVTYLIGLVAASGSGYGQVVGVDTGFGAQVGHWAFGLNIDMAVHSMPGLDAGGNVKDSTSPIGNGYVPELDYALGAAYGRRVLDTDKLTIDVGAAARVAMKVYMLQINASEISKLISGSRDFENLPARGGIAVPFDLGTTFGFLNGKLRFDVTLTNLNGIYYMATYRNSKDAVSFKDGTDRYSLYTPWSLNGGVSYSFGFDRVDPTLYAKVSGINCYLDDENGDALQYIDAGIKVKVFDVVNLRASYRYGYPEFSIGASYYGNMLELSYGFQEAGSSYGEKPIDRLTFRMKLGYEK